MDASYSRRLLYPPIRPLQASRLAVGNGHDLYIEECGRPDGLPVVTLHGGPGGGVSPALRRFFDPRRYRVILFDQRGCGRSTPHGGLEHNTTQDLIDDIERIREVMGIDKWVVFGGAFREVCHFTRRVPGSVPFPGRSSGKCAVLAGKCAVSDL